MLVSTVAIPQTMQINTSNQDYEVTNLFSDVDDFEFTITVDQQLAVGLYDNSPLVEVIYRVSGILNEGTPSGFPAFDLERTISGDEFYAQGSSLSFEISETAILDDGIQVSELTGGEPVLIFNGREVDNESFHPALLELRADGAGRLQTSNNVPTFSSLLEISNGSEYFNALVFDPGNTTLITATVSDSSSGGGLVNPLENISLLQTSFLLVKFSCNYKNRTPASEKLRYFLRLTASQVAQRSRNNLPNPQRM